MPDMQFVDSSNVEAVGYDSDAQELHVRFIGGALYVYSEVPAEVFESLMLAPSVGSFLNREIKNIYQYSKE